MTFVPDVLSEDFGPLTLGSGAGSVSLSINGGLAGIMARLEPPTGGEITLEGTVDDVNFDGFTLRSTQTDEFLSQIETPADMIGSIAGFRSIRFRTSVPGTATGIVEGRLIRSQNTLEGIEHLPPPHKIGHPPQHRDASFTTAQTNTVLWDPGAGKRFYVTDLIIAVSGNTDGTMTIFDETNVTGKRLWRGVLDPSNQFGIYLHIPLGVPFASSGDGNKLRITTDANIAVDIVVHGYVVPTTP